MTRAMPTVAEFAPRALRHLRARLAPQSLERTAGVVRVHIVPAVGDVRVGDVGRGHLAELGTAWVESGARPRTVNDRLGTIARLLTVAVELEVIVSAPRPTYVRVPRDCPRWLTDDEAMRLIRAADEPWRSMMFVALRTGMRIGELRGLRWGDVDFARGVLIVRRSHPGRPGIPIRAPKSGMERSIALSPQALGILRVRNAIVHAERNPADVTTLPVWHRAGGAAMTIRGGWDAMQRACADAGLHGVHWHSLRHTCASALVMRGVPLRFVQQILGHASIRQTERYAHLAPEAAGHGIVASLDVPLGVMEFAVQRQPELPPGDSVVVD